MSRPELEFWTIYWNPSDYPGQYVARCYILDRPTEMVLIGRSLDEVRSLIPQGLYCLGREPNDDPCIVETWM